MRTIRARITSAAVLVVVVVGAGCSRNVVVGSEPSGATGSPENIEAQLQAIELVGQEDAADLRSPLRMSEADDLLDTAIDEAIGRKPKGHDFVIDRRHHGPAVGRHMSVTGG